ncbi:MAG: hypothetical protein WKG00_38595 [Polyangiaceae bacterium]
MTRAASIALCRLSDARLAMLRDDPSLIPSLHTEILDLAIPFALHVGPVSTKHLETMATRFRGYGPDAWPRIEAVLDGQLGEPLRGAARVLRPEDVALVAKALRVVATSARRRPSKGRLAAMVHGIAALFEEAARAGESVLAIGTTDPRADERAARGVTELDDVISRTVLHRRDIGFRHPRPEERRSSFWDLSDRFFETGSGAVRRSVVGQVRDLVLLWAAPGAALHSRELAALMLAHVARAIGRGGPAAADAAARLRESLAELESVYAEIFAEMPATARVAMALVCARAGMARATNVAGISDAQLRRLVEDAYDGNEAPYAAAVAAVEDAILQR